MRLQLNFYSYLSQALSLSSCIHWQSTEFRIHVSPIIEKEKIINQSAQIEKEKINQVELWRDTTQILGPRHGDAVEDETVAALAVDKEAQSNEVDVAAIVFASATDALAVFGGGASAADSLADSCG